MPTPASYAFFLDVQKAYDTVWRDGLWLKLWDMGVKGKMWRVVKGMYEVSRSAVLLDGEKSNMFSVEQGVAQGCSLSPILFSVFRFVEGSRKGCTEIYKCSLTLDQH